jgi:hypothetical protein
MRLASSQLPAQQLTERRCAHLCAQTESVEPQPTQVYFGYHTVPAFAAKLRTLCIDIAKSAQNRRREAGDRADSSELLELGNRRNVPKRRTTLNRTIASMRCDGWPLSPWQTS